MTLDPTSALPDTHAASPVAPGNSPAEVVRNLPCTMCWAMPGQACQDHPAGDHLRRWRDACEGALITRADLAVAVGRIPVITARSVVLEAAALVIADMATSFEAPADVSDPALYAGLTHDERDVLRAHLASGWSKQAVTYPTLALAWWETAALLDDLHLAWQAERTSRGSA